MKRVTGSHIQRIFGTRKIIWIATLLLFLTQSSTVLASGGWLLGALIGGGTGFLVGAATCSQDELGNIDDGCLGSSGLGGAIIGALIGAITDVSDAVREKKADTKDQATELSLLALFQQEIRTNSHPHIFPISRSLLALKIPVVDLTRPMQKVIVRPPFSLLTPAETLSL